MRTFYICSACGVQYEASETAPAFCKICSDVRQFVPITGWTDLDQLQNQNYRNEFVEVEPSLWSIRTYPQVAIRDILTQYEFDSIYGAFDHCIKTNGTRVVQKSADRYLSYLDQ
jgi:hypothetical protein